MPARPSASTRPYRITEIRYERNRDTSSRERLALTARIARAFGSTELCGCWNPKHVLLGDEGTTVVAAHPAGEPCSQEWSSFLVASGGRLVGKIRNFLWDDGPASGEPRAQDRRPMSQARSVALEEIARRTASLCRTRQGLVRCRTAWLSDDDENGVVKMDVTNEWGHSATRFFHVCNTPIRGHRTTAQQGR